MRHHKLRVLKSVCLSACPPTATPHPGGFKCFTCEDAADNYECNRWAPDVYCPKGISAFSLLQCEHFWDINTISLCSNIKIIQKLMSCLPDARYCYTLHMMDSHGDSVSVTKRCVTLEDCRFTGCAEVTDNGYRVRGASGLNCINVLT